MTQMTIEHETQATEWNSAIHAKKFHKGVVMNNAVLSGSK